MKPLLLTITLFLSGSLAFSQSIKNMKTVKNKNIITVMWTVAKEPFNYYCQVEVSTDGKHFEAVSQLNGKPSYMDMQYYYQLKTLNNDKIWVRVKKIKGNQTEYSAVQEIKNQPMQLLLTQLPNDEVK